MIALENQVGHNNYEIVVSGGKAVLCHRSYNPDGHKPVGGCLFFL